MSAIARKPQAGTAEEFRRFMCRHLVSLCGTFHRLENGRPLGDEQAFGVSGFVILVGEMWAYVTAGHVLTDELIGPVERGLVRIHKWGLADYFGPDPKNRDPVPFALGDAAKCYLDNERLGLDFALIALRDFYTSALRANGVVPITRSNWAQAVHLDFEAYAMLGFPTKLTESLTRQGERGEQIGIAMAPVLVWVEKLDHVPASVIPPQADWFVGRIDVPFEIHGMSGGPIFGFRRDSTGQWTYHAVAVQSRYYPISQVILGCPVPIFMGLVEQELARYLAGAQDRN